MSIEDQIKQIEAMRDKAIAAYERAVALSEKHRKEADDFNTALDVLAKISPDTDVAAQTKAAPTPHYWGGSPPAAPSRSAPIYQRILNLLQESEQMWWTANQIQEALEAKGDIIKMTSISPNLSRLKDSGDIVRDDLKIALANRMSQNTEAPEGDLLGRNPSEASNQTGLCRPGEPPAQGREAVPGGGT